MLSVGKWAFALIGLAMLGVLPASASADIYWANYRPSPEAIGHAESDGSNATDQYVPGAEPACDVAAQGDFVYWTGGSGDGYVGRANVNTGAVENSFITTADDLPCGVDVNSTHIYFNNYASGAIGRANLDGSAINQTFVDGGVNPQHPFVTDDTLFWTNKGFGCPPGCSVGRAGLDGSFTEPTFIDNTDDEPSGVAANDQYIYWGNGGKIGRTNIDGTNRIDSFIDTPTYVCDVAIDDTYIYWADYGNGDPDPGYIGRAKLDGSEMDPQFIQTASDTCGVYVSDDDDAGFTFVTDLRITCAGTCRVVTVRITFDAAGRVIAEQIIDDRAAARGSAAAKKKPKKAFKKLKQDVAAGTAKLKLPLTKAGKRTFKKKGKLKADMRFTFKPSDGSPATVETVKLRISKKK